MPFTAKHSRPVTLLIIVTAFGAGCAHTPVTQNLTLYQGEEWTGLEDVTYDGSAFTLPDGSTVPREDVQTVQIRLKERQARAHGEAGAGGGLSPLAASMVERGRLAADRHPGVPGVILVDDGVFVYHEDGTWGYRYHFAGLVLKEEAKGWAQVAVSFTDGRSRARILFGRSVGPDGTVHTLSPDRIREGSPSEDMRFFNPNRKVLSGVIPGVEVGSIVEYSYESETYDPEDPRLFFPGYYFQATEPVVFSRAVVEVPQSITFNHMTRNFPEGLEEPVIENKGNTLRYTWTLEDMPPLPIEPLMPPQRDLVPMMDGSVFESYEAAFAVVRALQENRIRRTPEIDAKVAELTADAHTVEDKIARIYHWIQENTRYISIKGSLGAGWSGHTAQETFESRYGDCTDKAILFTTMLETIGVTSYPVIVTTNDAGTAVTEIPTITGNHCINEVMLDGRRFYLDSTSENYRYPYFRMDDHGVMAFNAIRGDALRIPVPLPSDNRRHSTLEMTLTRNGDVFVKTKNEYTGSIEAGIRAFWKRTRKDNRQYLMAEYVNSISPGAVLDNFTLSDLEDLSKQVWMTIDYALPGHAIRAKKLMYLRMPTLERDYPEAALESRNFPVQYMTTEERVLEMDLTLPKGFRVRWVPPPLEWSSPYLEFRAAYEEAPGRVVYRETFRRLKRVVPVDDYPAYRDALRAIAAFSQKEIFLTEEQ